MGTLKITAIKFQFKTNIEVTLKFYLDDQTCAWQLLILKGSVPNVVEKGIGISYFIGKQN